MNIVQFYETIGGDYSAVLSRLGSEALIKKIVVQFVKDQTFAELNTAFENKDVETAFRSAHTLKGVCLNLGFDCLSGPAVELTEKLRKRTFDDTESSFETVKKQYEIVIAALKDVE